MTGWQGPGAVRKGPYNWGGSPRHTLWVPDSCSMQTSHLIPTRIHAVHQWSQRDIICHLEGIFCHLSLLTKVEPCHVRILYFAGVMPVCGWVGVGVFAYIVCIHIYNYTICIYTHNMYIYISCIYILYVYIYIYIYYILLNIYRIHVGHMDQPPWGPCAWSSREGGPVAWRWLVAWCSCQADRFNRLVKGGSCGAMVP